MNTEPQTLSDETLPLWREHIQRIVQKRVYEPADVEDIVSTVMVSLLERRDTYDPTRGPAGAWVRLHIKDAMAEHFQRVAEERHYTTPLLLDHEQVADPRLSVLPVYEIIERERTLPEPLRATYNLVIIRGLTAGSAARTLGITRRTVCRHLARIREHFTP